MNSSHIETSNQLTRSERLLLDVMRSIGFGRLERIPVRDGALVLEPWPRTIRHLKLGSDETQPRCQLDREFQLKREVAEFFGQIRSLQSAEILRLEIRHGLPFTMEIENSMPMEGQDRG